ncbi:MAG TPA: SDR family oxidoreductase [Thermoplasmataceae archaeon]|nr:SDR family oxidoreductase [Thermoplasmataceae archaeon]
MSTERAAFITGGTSGLGNSLVRLFLDNGWKVATCGRRKNLLDELARDHGDDLLALACDIRFDNHLDSVIERIEEKWGSIDLIVLNAGEVGPVPLPEVYGTTLMDLRKTMETNFFANFNIIRKFAGLMKNPSLIAHITSDASSSPYPGWGAYGSSKAAMDQLIRILDEESKCSGINAFSFDPGDMRTEMHRKAIPEDDPDSLKEPDVSALELFSIVEKKLGVR